VIGLKHKVLAYIEYSTEQCLAASELLTPLPLSTQRVCPPPRTKGGGGRGEGGTHSPGGEGGGESIFRKTPDIGLASYSIIPLLSQVIRKWGRNTGSMAGRSGSIASTLEGVKDKLTVSFQLTQVKKFELTLL
jgi:hypothetical protein